MKILFGYSYAMEGRAIVSATYISTIVVSTTSVTSNRCTYFTGNVKYPNYNRVNFIKCTLCIRRVTHPNRQCLFPVVRVQLNKKKTRISDT